MTANDTPHQRAADFLRQWQEQMTRQMTHPDSIAAMLAAMQQFGAAPHDANARRPAHAPDARDDAIGNLSQRLRAVEQQLRELHARLDAAENPAGASKRTVAKPVEPSKRAVAKTKRTVAKPKPKSVAKPKRKQGIVIPSYDGSRRGKLSSER